uniref:DNA topoisomerase 2-binding protein 1 n=1 Tax=Haemonchus contortus TaxID=6289 RepID=A0A7I4XYG0_HAECO|nr:BRCT domain containing protein [Haemonchus contortus]
MNTPGAPRKSRRSVESVPITTQDGEEENIGEPVDVFCVRPDDPTITNEEEEYYRETFNLLNDYGVGAVWLSEEKALQVSTKNDSFYFVPAFRGRVFEHLKKAKVNLYGVHVVRQTLNNGGSLPRWDFPVYALNMTGACICFTGLSLDRREELKEKINWMNGVVSPCLTERVTHLVTEYCDTASKKYTEARRMNLPIMLPSWIEAAWDAAQRFSVDLFTSKEFAQQYRTPIFNKMVITATGVGGRERMDIARLIELHGGRFSGDMKRNECTHLIADHSKGMKYKKAREWNSIKIVRSTWLRKSVMAGYILPESAFDPEKRNRCSTPVQDSRIVEPEELDCSAIQGRGGRLDNSTFNTQVTKHDGESEAEPERTPMSSARCTNLRREPSRYRIATSTPAVPDPVDQLDETCLRNDFDFLEGCRIWVCGADQSRADKWKKILDRSGATRVAGMEAASHIVVVHASASDRSRLIQAKTRGIHVVRAEWITACYAEKDQVALEEFLWDPDNIICRTASFECAQALEETPRRLVAEHSSKADGPGTGTKDLGASDYLNLAPLGNLSDDPDVSSIFRALKFRVNGLPDDVEAQTVKELKSAGGKVVPSSDENTFVNYFVCGNIEFDHVQPTDNYGDAVTVFWVKRCLMEYRLLKSYSHPLFRPLPAVRESKVFSNVVAVISCFSDHERSTLAQLIKEFGGEVQEKLTKRNQGDQRAVTHVIGGSEGDRVAEARRQKFKVVDPSWVIESIVNDKLMKEDLFPLEGEAYVSYGGRTDDLWPEAARAANSGRLRASTSGRSSEQEVPRDDFSDLIVDELQLDRTPDQLIPRKTRATTSNTRPSMEEEAFKTSTPISAVPSRLRFMRLNDRTLDMNKPFKPNFQGLTQAVENIPSPGSTSGDTSHDSLTTTMVGRILKEGVIKTATAKPQRNARVSANSLTTSASAHDLGTHSPSKRRSTRKCVTRQGSAAKTVCSTIEKPDLDEMMALRAQMTEKLQQRNREFANQLAERNATAKDLPSQQPSQVGSLRGRKRGQPSTADAERPSKRPSQTSTGTSSEQETLRPLIEWQPAVPSKLTPNSVLNFEEPLNVTRPPVSQGTNFSDDFGQEPLARSTNEAQNRATEKQPAQASDGFDRISSRTDIRRTASGPSVSAAGAPQQSAAQSFSPNPRRALGETSTSGLAEAERRNTPQPPQGSSSPQGPGRLTANATSSNLRKAAGGDAITGDIAEAETRKSLQAAAVHENNRVGSGEANGNSSKPSSARISVKQERTSIVFSNTVRRFIFTSVLPHERLRLSNIISRLGGIADSGELSDECTHLICGKLIRGAKLMGCIASGRWVVGADYVDQSLAAGKWLPEADFELGEPSRLALTNWSEREQKLAQACRRWRLKLESNSPSTRRGAFSGWRCVLYCSDDKAAGLCPMLKAGGAEVAVRHRGEGAPLVFRPTHAVVCVSGMWSIEELEMLVNVGAKVFHLEYISKFLLEENVDEASCYHLDYKKLLMSRRR